MKTNCKYCLFANHAYIYIYIYIYTGWAKSRVAVNILHCTTSNVFELYIYCIEVSSTFCVLFEKSHAERGRNVKTNIRYIYTVEKIRHSVCIFRQ